MSLIEAGGIEKWRLFDTHAHYDHPRFGERGPEIVRKLFEAKTINGVVIPAISYESNFNRMLFPATSFPFVYFAAGVHPRFSICEAEWTDIRKQDFCRLFFDPRTVAIKTGLDFSRNSFPNAQEKSQRECLEYMSSLSHQFDLPMVFHVREAASEITQFLKDNQPKVEIEVHCFTYDYMTAVTLMKAGVTRFGIGGMLTRDGMDELRNCVKNLPLSTILLETDAPYVKPKGYKGAVNTSETLLEIVRLIADLKSLSVDSVVEAVQKNAADFFRIQV